MVKKIIVFTLLPLILITACKNNGDIKETGVLAGHLALDFTEQDSNGEDFSLSTLKGKVILLYFGTFNCPGCKVEMSDIMTIYSKYRERGLEIVVCNYENEKYKPSTKDDLQRLIKAYGLKCAVINDPDKSTVKQWVGESIPLNLVIDRGFVIRYRHSGYIKAWIEGAIKQSL
jgi:peroxiredoxin